MFWIQLSTTYLRVARNYATVKEYILFLMQLVYRLLSSLHVLL